MHASECNITMISRGQGPGAFVHPRDALPFLTHSTPGRILIGARGSMLFMRGLPCLITTSQVPIPTLKSDFRAEISYSVLP